MIPGWKKTTLGAACHIEKGKASAANEPPGIYPLITTGDRRKSASDWQFEGPAVCVPMISAFGHGKPGLKRVHYQEGKFALANILSALLVKNPEELSARFLAVFLNFYKEQLIVPLQFGAANMSVTVERLATVQIWFPLLREQERILGLIDETETLRAARAQTDARMEKFIPALFDEVFGNPSKNPHNWAITKLEDVTDRIIDCPHATPKFLPEGLVCLKTSNLTRGGWNWNPTWYVSEKGFQQRIMRSEVLPGDIVLSREGTVGIAAIVEDGMKVCLGQRLVQVRVKHNVTIPEYLLNALLYELDPVRLSKAMSGSTSKHFNMLQIRNLKILLPPLALQREFAERVGEARAIQSAQGRSAERIEALYQSMLSRAFAGEL